jgi:hypothetical protein
MVDGGECPREIAMQFGDVWGTVSRGVLSETRPCCFFFDVIKGLAPLDVLRSVQFVGEWLELFLAHLRLHCALAQDGALSGVASLGPPLATWINDGTAYRPEGDCGATSPLYSLCSFPAAPVLPRISPTVVSALLSVRAVMGSGSSAAGGVALDEVSRFHV